MNNAHSAEGAKYWLIICNHVLEHTLDPKGPPQRIHALLEPKGITSEERAYYASEILTAHPLPQDQITIPPAFHLPRPRHLKTTLPNQLRMPQGLGVLPSVDLQLTILPSPGAFIGNLPELTFHPTLDESAPPSSPRRTQVHRV